jgi:hypothetical protein
MFVSGVGHLRTGVAGASVNGMTTRLTIFTDFV